MKITADKIIVSGLRWILTSGIFTGQMPFQHQSTQLFYRLCMKLKKHFPTFIAV